MGRALDKHEEAAAPAELWDPTISELSPLKNGVMARVRGMEVRALFI
jgi:hypothetical protein